jgi:hypothetical protein
LAKAEAIEMRDGKGRGAEVDSGRAMTG